MVGLKVTIEGRTVEGRTLGLRVVPEIVGLSVGLDTAGFKLELVLLRGRKTTQCKNKFHMFTETN
jgi:hypothetical protein